MHVAFDASTVLLQVPVVPCEKGRSGVYGRSFSDVVTDVTGFFKKQTLQRMLMYSYYLLQSLFAGFFAFVLFVSLSLGSLLPAFQLFSSQIPGKSFLDTGKISLILKYSAAHLLTCLEIKVSVLWCLPPCYAATLSSSPLLRLSIHITVSMPEALRSSSDSERQRIRRSRPAARTESHVGGKA